MEESVLNLKERKKQHNIGFPTFKLPAKLAKLDRVQFSI